MVFTAVELVCQVETIALPGAMMSTQLPVFEYEARESLEVLAATVMAAGTRAGE